MNKVMLIGYVGKEPEVHYYDTDQCVASFPLATTERGYTLANGTKVPDHTDWHDIVLFKNLSKYAEKYIHKGDKLKKGIRRQVTEIYVDSLEWLATSKKNEVSNVGTDDPLPMTDNIDNFK